MFSLISLLDVPSVNGLTLMLTISSQCDVTRNMMFDKTKASALKFRPTLGNG